MGDYCAQDYKKLAESDSRFAIWIGGSETIDKVVSFERDDRIVIKGYNLLIDDDRILRKASDIEMAAYDLECPEDVATDGWDVYQSLQRIDTWKSDAELREAFMRQNEEEWKWHGGIWYRTEWYFAELYDPVRGREMSVTVGCNDVDTDFKPYISIATQDPDGYYTEYIYSAPALLENISFIAHLCSIRQLSSDPMSYEDHESRMQGLGYTEPPWDERLMGGLLIWVREVEE